MCLIFVFWADSELFLTTNINQITVFTRSDAALQ